MRGLLAEEGQTKGRDCMPHKSDFENNIQIDQLTSMSATCGSKFEHCFNRQPFSNWFPNWLYLFLAFVINLSVHLLFHGCFSHKRHVLDWTGYCHASENIVIASTASNKVEASVNAPRPRKYFMTDVFLELEISTIAKVIVQESIPLRFSIRLETLLPEAASFLSIYFTSDCDLLTKDRKIWNQWNKQNTHYLGWSICLENVHSQETLEGFVAHFEKLGPLCSAKLTLFPSPVAGMQLQIW